MLQDVVDMKTWSAMLTLALLTMSFVPSLGQQGGYGDYGGERGYGDGESPMVGAYGEDPARDGPMDSPTTSNDVPDSSESDASSHIPTILGSAALLAFAAF